MTDSSPLETSVLSPLAAEFEGAKFGDSRLTERLLSLAASAESEAAASFPALAGSDAALEGTYRFLNNEKVTPSAILAPHIARSCRRAESAGRVFAIHDTTSFNFGGLAAREGLGPIQGNGQGFFAHFALAVAGDSSRYPLGVVGLHTHVRGTTKKVEQKRVDQRADPTRESLRWRNLAHEVGERLSGCAEVIHVMDREGDSYELLSSLLAGKHRFIIRNCLRRRLPAIGQDDVPDEPGGTRRLIEREVPCPVRPTLGFRTACCRESGAHKHACLSA